MADDIVRICKSYIESALGIASRRYSSSLKATGYEMKITRDLFLIPTLFCLAGSIHMHLYIALINSHKRTSFKTPS